MSAPPAPRVEVVDRQGNAILLRVHTLNGYLPTWRHFLVGQDSNNMAQPFITQVFRKLQTVEEAFESLMPKAVKEAKAKGLEVKRQGDWFFIPSRPPQGPSCHLKPIEQAKADGRPVPQFQFGALYGANFWEPPTRHTVRPWFSIQDGTQIVYRVHGPHYVRGAVDAPDHETLFLEDWHVAHRACSGPWGRNGRQVGGD